MNLVASFAVPPCGRRFVLNALRHARLVVGLLSVGVASFESRLGALSAPPSQWPRLAQALALSLGLARQLQQSLKLLLASFSSPSFLSLRLRSHSNHPVCESQQPLRSLQGPPALYHSNDEVLVQNGYRIQRLRNSTPVLHLF